MIFTVIIPARYASQRLPGKPLQDIGGKLMIEHVYNRAKQSQAEQVVVATDDQRIYDAVQKFGGDACMTSSEHISGTDRLQEVVRLMQLPEDHIVVNVQGDEPLIPPAVINQVARNLSLNLKASAATLCEPIVEILDVMNPNVVKVVRDLEGLALYFSRAAIPWSRETYSKDMYCKVNPNTLPAPIAYRHIGIYAYRIALLNQFVNWPMAELEAVEKLEQLRIMANGQKIHVDEACEVVPGGVDTQEDLERIRQNFK